MSESAQQLAMRLTRLTAPGARNRLLARGDARALVWRDGIVPSGVRGFTESLTPDLLDHGYSVLAAALRLRDLRGDEEVSRRALLSAAEAIEFAVRKGPPNDRMRGFHTVVAAAAFHLARYAARSFCLVKPNLDGLNLSSAERALALLLRRNFAELRRHLLEWLLAPEHSDANVAEQLVVDDKSEIDLDSLVALAITANLHRALGALEFAMTTGELDAYAQAVNLLQAGCLASDQANHIPLWWANTLARHLATELWDHSLHTRLPPTLGDAATVEEEERWSWMRHDFIVLQARKKLSSVDLWPSQLESAARAVDSSDDLVVALPTSAGKTRVAELCILRTLAAGRRVVYVTPLRALSAQVEHGLARMFRPLGFSVSALYGASGVAAADINVLQTNDIVVATPEKLDFSIRQQPAVLDTVGLIVLDEGHMIGLGTREVRYEALVQRLLRRADAEIRRIVCLSAIFSPGDAFSDFTAWLRSDEPGAPVHSSWRPTRPRPATLLWSDSVGRLDFLIDEKPYVPRFIEEEGPAIKIRKNSFPQNDNEFILATVKRLLADDHSVLVYCPVAKSVEPLAELYLKLIRQRHLTPVPFNTSLEQVDQARQLHRALAVGKEWLGEEHVAVRALRIGVAVHHGGLPRAFLSEIEALLGDRVLKVALASPTLAQGIDLSCSALVLRSIYRGSKKIKKGQRFYREPLTVPAEELANVMGRAGRAFVDLDGLTIYPIFNSNPTTQSRRKKEFANLLEAARSRQLKSGLVELVGELAARLRKHLMNDCSWEELEEYILNTTGFWESSDSSTVPWYSRTADEEVPQEDDDTDEDEDDDQGTGPQLLDDLDVAILASVEQLECDPEDVAEALDEVLRSSLWRRHLERESPPQQGAFRALLQNRATWLWEKTSPAQRRAFFSTGVGYNAGGLIDANIDALVKNLELADANLSIGDIDNAVIHIIYLARFFMQVPTFSTSEKHRPDEWEAVVAEWVRGTELGSILKKHGNKCTRFIQDGIIYRLVWAFEAVRAHALSDDKAFAKNLSGHAARALTYGVPSLQAALLLQNGLPSRRMSLQLLADIPDDFMNPDGLREWLVRISPIVDMHDYWKDPGERIIWSEFQRERRREVNREWTYWTKHLDVTWNEGITIPEQNTPLRLIREPAGSHLWVCSPDLHVLGRVSEWPQYLEEDCVLAKSGETNEHIIAECLGPKRTESQA
jgi:hypothetical protein